MVGFATIRDAQIDGEFTGFDGETLFAFTDGTFWAQEEYKYWYHYAYRPQVRLVELGGRLYLEAFGQSVAVRQVFNVIISQVEGTFQGWNGDSEYKLTNGQTWKQAAYKYTYRYAYRPRALVYDSGSGLVMDVAGTRAKVRRA